MSDFNFGLPEWNKKGIEPPKSKKDAGWQVDERPPADYMNWLQNMIFEALKELQEKAVSLDRYTPEMLAARTEKIIRDRLIDNDIPSSKLRITENASRIQLMHLADEVLQAIAGNAPVNVTPAANSVTTEKIALEAVTPEKLSASTYKAIEQSALFKRQDIGKNWFPHEDRKLADVTKITASSVYGAYRSYGYSKVTFADGVYTVGAGGYAFTNFNYAEDTDLNTKIYVYIHSDTGLDIVGGATSSLSIEQTVNGVSAYTKMSDLGNGWYGIELTVDPRVITGGVANSFFQVRIDNREIAKPVTFDEVYVSDKPMQLYQNVYDQIFSEIENANLGVNSINNDLAVVGRPDENILENSFGEYPIDEAISIAANNPYTSYLSASLATSGNGEVVVQPGGYYFYRLKPYGSLEVGKKLYVYAHIKEGYNSSVNICEVGTDKTDDGTDRIYSSFKAIGDGWYKAETGALKADFTTVEIRMDNRTMAANLVFDKLIASPYDTLSMLNLNISRMENKVVSGGSGGITKYVSLSGSDENNGDTYAGAYATFQKAIDEGATTIIAERGLYFQSLSKSNNGGKIEIIPYTTGYTDNNTPPVKIELRGSDILKDWALHSGNVWKQAYAGGYNWKAVFIDKTLTPISTSSRPAPNAGLWEGNDKYTDTKLIPVLTLQECIDTEQTFYWDGTTVYMHPKGGVIDGKEFNAIVRTGGVSLTGYSHVKLVDVKADFVKNAPMNLQQIKYLEAYGSEAGHSGSTDGFILNYSEGVMHQCEAYKNRNDGFNAHYEGDITLFNCKGFNNYDDGISFHEIARGVIYGGQWFGNHKGGIIHVNASKFDVYDAVCYGNRYGVYFSGALDEGEYIDIVVKGCVCYDNQDGIVIGQSYNALIEDCDTRGNENNMQISGNAKVEILNSKLNDAVVTGISSSTTGEVTLADCKVSDNPTGVYHTGSGEMKLSRNNILFNDRGIDGAGLITVAKRNNLYGNTMDYAGAIAQSEKDKNVSIPAI